VESLPLVLAELAQELVQVLEPEPEVISIWQERMTMEMKMLVEVPKHQEILSLP